MTYYRASLGAAVLLALITTSIRGTGSTLDTPATVDAIDPAVCVLRDGTGETLLSSQTTISHVLWTQDSWPQPAQFSYGAAPVPGARHLRLGFKSSLSIGSVLVIGQGRLSALKSTAAYPGDLEDESQWIPAQRIRKAAITETAADMVAYQPSLSLWVLPPGTTTRAVRMTIDNLYLDEKFAGGVQRLYIFGERLANLASAAFILPRSNLAGAAGLYDGFQGSAWDNTSPGSAPGTGGSVIVSPDNPEDILLVWPEPVELAGLATFDTGFGAAEVQSYVGPANRHPRDATDADWQTVMSLNGFGANWAQVAGPLIWAFPSSTTTRAIRLRMVETSDSPFHGGQTAEGKRVWLNELMALKPLGSDSLETGIVPSPFPPHPPIPVTFSLTEPAVVTLVIEDATGKRVRNLASETPFPAGISTVWWDGFDDQGILSLDDRGATAHFDPTGTVNLLGGLNRAQGTLCAPGTYRVRGLERQPINLRYEFTAYNSGEPPWQIQNGIVPVWETTGQWLADHYPPRDLVFLPGPTNQVFIASPVAESGDALVWVDLAGRKLAGRKSVLGYTCNWEYIEEDWTGASHVARDDGPNALADVAAYLAVAFHDGLRIHSLSHDRCLRKVIKRPWDQPEDANILGIAAYDGRLVVSVNPRNELWFVDAATGDFQGAASLDDPRGLTFDPAGRLLVLSGSRLLQFEVLPGSTTLLDETEITADLEDPRDVELDANGDVYVSQHGTRHNVKVFSAAGDFLHEIGTPGPVAPGPYDETHMQLPEGMSVTPDGHLWVAEFNHAPKRVSVWTLDGTFVQAFYGPTKYGGGGQIDPLDPTRFYLFEQEGGMEFQLDWTNGTSRLASIYYRLGPNDWKMPIQDWGRSTAGPETPIYLGGHQYMTDAYRGDTGALPGFGIWRIHDGVAVPVAACSRGDVWPMLAQSPFKEALPTYDLWNPHFVVWSDLNSDGQAQTSELQYRHERAINFTLNAGLELVTSDARIYRPVSFTETGVPVYDLSAGETLLPGFEQNNADTGGVLATTNEWSVVVGGPLRGIKQGQVAWNYSSHWPSLHYTWNPGRPPLPSHPGQLIGTTRALGLPILADTIEPIELFGVNGNFGNVYLLSTDGLFVATLFRDTRVAPGWRMPYRQRGMLLNDVSLGEETFNPYLTRTESGDIYLTAGHNHASLVKVEGLDTIRRFNAPDIELTPELLAQAHTYHLETEAASVAWHGRDTLFVSAPATPPIVDGQTNDWTDARWINLSSQSRAAVAVSAGRLFLAFAHSPTDHAFNDAEDPVPLFESGGGFDLQLGTDPNADPLRDAPVAGDLRLLMTRRDGLIRALLLRPVADEPSSPAEFASSWRTNTVASVEDIGEQVEFEARLGQNSFELSVPLSALGLVPSAGLAILGDIGLLHGRAGQIYDRAYWHNQATDALLDLAGETMLTPQLWGYWQFPDELPPPSELLSVAPSMPMFTNAVVWEQDLLRLDAMRGAGVRREFFGWPAEASLDSLTNRTLNPRFPNRFEETDVWISDLDIPFRATARYQPERLRAWLIPPITGDYRFWISSDEPSVLRLGTNGLPHTDLTLASVPDRSGYRQWDQHPAQQSQPIHLQAGTSYYLEILRMQNFSDEHFTVRWQLPDGRFEEPIPACRLVPVQGSISSASAAGPTQHLEFSLESDGAEGAQIDPITGQLTWVPGETFGGTSHQLTVRLSDLNDPTTPITRTFNVSVLEANSPPTLTLSDQVVDEGQTLLLQTGHDDDIPADALSFELRPPTAGASIEPATGTLAWTPTEAQGPGSYPITVKVTDSGSPPRSATNTFTVTVNEINAAPTLLPIGDHTIEALQPLIIELSANDNLDLPANALNFSAENLPAGAVFDSRSAQFTWTPSEAQSPASYPITFTVTDDGIPPLSVSETTNITVIEPPRPVTVSGVEIRDGQFRFTFTTQPGKSYLVQAKTNLDDPVWIDLLTLPAPPVLVEFTEPFSGTGTRYYRVITSDASTGR